MSEVKSDYDYNYKNELQVWKENKEFECQNILMSRPPLYLTHVGTNTTNAKHHICTRLLLGAKMPDLKKLTLPTESSKRKEKPQKEYVPDDPESDPSFSDSSSRKSDLSNDRKYI